MKCPLCSKDFETAEYGTSVPCPHCGDFVKVPVLQICPNCFNKSETRRRICIECGYDFDSGCVIATQKGTEVEYSLIQRLAWSLREAMPGLFRPAPLIGFILCAAIGAAAVILAAAAFGLGAYLSAFGIAIAGMMIYVHGVAFICYGELCVMKAVLGEITGKAWSAFVCLTSLPLILWIILLLLIKNGVLKC